MKTGKLIIAPAFDMAPIRELNILITEHIIFTSYNLMLMTERREESWIPNIFESSAQKGKQRRSFLTTFHLGWLTVTLTRYANSEGKRSAVFLIITKRFLIWYRSCSLWRPTTCRSIRVKEYKDRRLAGGSIYSDLQFITRHLATDSECRTRATGPLPLGKLSMQHK